MGTPREGVECNGLIGEVDGPLVEPGAGRNLRQRDEERRVLRVDAKGQVPGFREPGGVVGQEPGGRERGQRLSAPGIDGEGLFGLRCCGLVILEVEIEILPILKALRRVEQRDGVFRDSATELMWARRDNGADIRWQDAGEYCSESGFAGLDDWRLPTLAELKSLQAIWSRARYKTVAKILLSACCPWSSELDGESGAWGFDYRFRQPVLGHRAYSLGQRALCVRFEPAGEPTEDD